VARKIAVVLTAVTAALAAIPVAAPPASAQYQPVCAFVIDPPSVPETGGTIVIEGFGAPGGSTVTVYLIRNGQQFYLGETVAGAGPGGGDFRATVRVPPLPNGEYVVQISCGGLAVSSIFTVRGGDPPGPATRPGPLPRTGFDPWLLVRIALLLLAVGGYFMYEARRRRHTVV
jgi:hypothetical protein